LSTDPPAQGDLEPEDIPVVVSVYKLSELADLSAVAENYDIHSIPGYAISFNHATPVDVPSVSSSRAAPAPVPPSHNPLPPFATATVTTAFSNSQSKSVPQYTPRDPRTRSTAKATNSDPTPATATTANIPREPPLSSASTSEQSTFAAAKPKRKYKPAHKKVKPVGATLPEEFRIVRNITGDPLADMPVLSPITTDFVPTGRYTEAERDIIDKNHPEGFLTEEERRFMHNFMMTNESGFAWNESQKGSFNKEYFPPVRMPIIEHVPWTLKNMPIPPGTAYAARILHH
jgi:hypothetical protein